MLALPAKLSTFFRQTLLDTRHRGSRPRRSVKDPRPDRTEPDTARDPARDPATTTRPQTVTSVTTCIACVLLIFFKPWQEPWLYRTIGSRLFRSTLTKKWYGNRLDELHYPP